MNDRTTPEPEAQAGQAVATPTPKKTRLTPELLGERLANFLMCVLGSFVVLGPFGLWMGKVFGTHLPRHPGWIMVGVGAGLSLLMLFEQPLPLLAVILCPVAAVAVVGLGLVSDAFGHRYYGPPPGSNGPGSPQTSDYQRCFQADLTLQVGTAPAQQQEQAYDLLHSDTCKYYRAGVP